MMMPFPIRFKSIWRVFEIASVGKIKRGSGAGLEVVYSGGAYVQLGETGVHLIPGVGLYNENA